MNTREKQKLLSVLEKRFESNMSRHKGLKWSLVLNRLEDPKKLLILNSMEASGGEPDVIEFNKKTGEFLFVDCSAETPK